MCAAILSDIHENLSARLYRQIFISLHATRSFTAVTWPIAALAPLRSSIEFLNPGWQGAVGKGNEILPRSKLLEDFANWFATYAILAPSLVPLIGGNGTRIQRRPEAVAMPAH
jgi:hypothetical protein